MIVFIRWVFNSLLRVVAPKYYARRGKMRLLAAALEKLRTPMHIQDFAQIHELILRRDWADRNTEHLMIAKYHDLLPSKAPREEFRAHEVNLFAQNGEDGLLLYIFSKIGMGNRKYVYIGCGGTNNAANLVLNYGFSGLEVDLQTEKLERTREFYRRRSGTGHIPTTIQRHEITPENANRIIDDAGISGEIDMLCIDIDGDDYWVWKSIDVIKPRLVLMEYNASFGPDRSITLPPRADMSQCDSPFQKKWYHGASLTALTKLAGEKGYCLVGCESNGVNAFFVRKDLMEGAFEELTSAEAFYPHFQRPGTPDEQFEKLKDLEYVEV